MESVLKVIKANNQNGLSRERKLAPGRERGTWREGGHALESPAQSILLFGIIFTSFWKLLLAKLRPESMGHWVLVGSGRFDESGDGTHCSRRNPNDHHPHRICCFAFSSLHSSARFRRKPDDLTFFIFPGRNWFLWS